MVAELARSVNAAFGPGAEIFCAGSKAQQMPSWLRARPGKLSIAKIWRRGLHRGISRWRIIAHWLGQE